MRFPAQGFGIQRAWRMGLAMLALLPSGTAHAQVLADPRLPWYSADSAHFRVHYREGQRAPPSASTRASRDRCSGSRAA